MATLTKEVTTGANKRHTPAMFIRGAQIDEETLKAYVAFSPMNETGNDAPTNFSSTLPCTKNAYRRISKGIGSVSRSLRNGLIGLSRYNFVVVTDAAGTDDAGNKTEECVTHVHAYPNQNYVSADATEELRYPVGDNEAIVQVHSSGDIDIMAFPAEFYTSIRRFITELEKLDTIDDMTEITFSTHEGKVNARIIVMNGNTLRFDLTVAR